MRIATTALLAFTLVALPAAAGSLAGVNLPDKVEVKGQSLVLNGLGLRTKFFIKVYVGGLYLPQKEKAPAKILSEDVLNTWIGPDPGPGADFKKAVLGG
jgi:hypothetical protein